MKEYFRGFLKIFSFTFKQHVRNGAYKRSTIIVALICLLLPASIMIGLEAFGDNPERIPESGINVEIGDAIEDDVYEEEPISMAGLEKIYVVDLSKDKYEDADFSKVGLELVMAQAYGVNVEVIDCKDNLEKAQKTTKGSDNALILVTEQMGTEYSFITLIPEGSKLNEDVAYNFDTFVVSGYSYMFNDIENPIDESEIITDMTEEEMLEAEAESAKELVSMIVLYLNIMLLYFFVLFYGQGVANSVVMEKSSKLMESMLVTVNPVAIILGKLFAITLTGIIQILSWVGSIGLSFAIGMYGVKAINPDTTMGIIEMFEMLREMTEGMFSPINCILAVIVIILGMLLYCSLAGIGGAMASKAEDLSSANMMFTLILVISFLATLYGGGMDGASNPVLDWIPFTAVMVTPANALLGNIPVWQTLAVIGIILVTTVAITLIAGRVYQSLVFYRGDALRPSYILKVLKGKN
ncbi:MAG: ABC transporter permease [Firmicutes bacterium]|nr:ABC transporter permease [Bacillota bacterium]